MGQEIHCSHLQKPAIFRLCNVSGYTTELLEIQSDSPTSHVLLVPGNPGVVLFYKEFVESVYVLLGGFTSITVIGYISQTNKNWEHGRLFSLQEQIDHKVSFIRQELQNDEVPIVLVGHSIGAYIALDILRRMPEKVTQYVGLYPFLVLNQLSKQQIVIGKLARSSFLSTVVSLIVAFFGVLPKFASRFIVSKSIGRTWSATAIEAACSHLLQYHNIRNILFLAMTEFKKLAETPDWEFMRENRDKISFLFGADDHWGPLEMYEEILKQVPGIALAVEREGHTHSFSCTEAGSVWVARHVANLITKNKLVSRGK